ncbi:hypothetical protein [Roseitranquillus sediminis]|nr:hypothetical protein [Roseitranquillus sediminis]MBM9595102.1 hypothetical protein [Roseitranquillus sediminis]
MAQRLKPVITTLPGFGLAALAALMFLAGATEAALSTLVRAISSHERLT